MRMRELMKIVEAPESIRSQGWEDARQGAKLSANPHPKGSKEAHEWEVGYQNYFFS